MAQLARFFGIFRQSHGITVQSGFPPRVNVDTCFIIYNQISLLRMFLPIVRRRFDMPPPSGPVAQADAASVLFEGLFF